MSSRDLARPELLKIKALQIPEQRANSVRLNANEAPLPLPASGADSNVNRYPLVRPSTLRRRVSEVLEVPQEYLLISRGSTEAVDVLIRTFCRAYVDHILMTPPTFEVYRLFADVQGVDTIRVSLDVNHDFAFPTQQILETCTEKTKLIFVCTPNNPTGSVVARADILALAAARRDQSIVVVDEAYLELSQQQSLAMEVKNFDNLVVLRTLSKVYALAGARCGIAIACPDLVDVLQRVIPPFAFPQPAEDLVLKTLADDGLQQANSALAEIVAERQRVYPALAQHKAVKKIWPSEANFLFLQFHDLARVQNHLLDHGILILAIGELGTLDNCARVTIGTAAENNLLLQTLDQIAVER